MTELLIQGSDAWRAARVGSLGASALHEVVARTKSGYSASRANAMARLLVERLTGQEQDAYQNAAMLHGIETEPEARVAYEFRTNADVMPIGLVRHPTIEGTHASPDGLVGVDGLVEIKCPQPAAHLATLLGEPIPDKYIVQMQWQMRCCDRTASIRPTRWCDFVSYSPAFPEAMRLHVKRVPRHDARIIELEMEVRTFLDELSAKMEELQRYGSPPGAVVRESLSRSLAGAA